MAKGPLFLNTPISSADQDAVGINLFVDKLNTAINEGAQMIAVTSPFGAGKSSVIEMLQHTHEKRVWWKFWQRKDVFVEVSMWSHLNNQKSNGSTVELHKSFIYQMASQIRPRKGTYISRRLSQNYGLLRLHTNKRINWFLIIMALLLFALQWFLTNYSETAISWIPWLKDKTGWIAAAMLFCAAIIAIIILTTTDVIFSSNKSEGARTIDSDEIMDLYRMELLKPRYNRFRWWKRFRHGVRYIVIVEDLDRTDEPETVLSFLKELRKYYIPEKDVAATYVNQINFIVTIKPEALLVAEAEAKTKKTEEMLQGEDSEKKENEGVGSSRESLYAKIFDYTLTLQTINIENYDAVLHELLKGHRSELKALGAFGNIDIEEENLANLPGMTWIIREERIGVREIKERLNIAFTLFETLKNRCQNAGVTFERCAAAAYLMTAFEEDFIATTDSAFQNLVEYYLHLPRRNEKTFTDVADKFAEHLGGTSENYQRAVWDLIRSKQIESSYRMYYYNYPRASAFYTAAEGLINSAIMLGEAVDGLEEAAQTVASAHSKVIRETYEKLKQLGMPLPVFVFEIEPLYVEAVRYDFDELLKRMADFDYSDEGAKKTVDRFARILGFDPGRAAYCEVHAKKFCQLWEKEMSEPTLLQLRLMLCRELPQEILWYHTLFRGTHGIISGQEMDAIPFCYALELVDCSNENFSQDEVGYIVRRYTTQVLDQERGDLQKQTEDFLQEAAKYLSPDESVLLLTEFMKANGEITESLEDIVCGYIEKSDARAKKSLLIDAEEEDGEEQDDNGFSVNGDIVFAEYQQLVNQIAPTGLSKKTIKWIGKLKHYDGYSIETALQLRESGYLYEYLLVTLCRGEEIAYGEPEVVKAVLENTTQLCETDQKMFLRLRTDMLESNPELLGQYNALFGNGYPIITERELKALEGESQDVDLTVIDLLPAAKVTESTVGYLSDFFCRCKHKQGIALRILCFVGELESPVAKKLFYSLDFDAIPYRRFAKEKQKRAKSCLAEVLELDATENKIKFMAATRYLDAEWESELETELIGDVELEKAYVNAANCCERVSYKTTSIITKLSTVYGTAPHITDRVYQEKKYFWYVSSKTHWDKKFVMEDDEVLWNTYVEMFGKTKSDSWQWTRARMEENTEFLYKLMDRREYVKFDDENRMKLSKIQQDEGCVEEAFSRGDEFALSYFLKVSGFQDKNAASKFMDLIITSEELLASNELYEHIYEKLVDGTLKAKYTYRRNRQTGT